MIDRLFDYPELSMSTLPRVSFLLLQLREAIVALKPVMCGRSPTKAFPSRR
jgi:hypothetical protein